MYPSSPGTPRSPNGLHPSRNAEKAVKQERKGRKKWEKCPASISPPANPAERNDADEIARARACLGAYIGAPFKDSGGIRAGEIRTRSDEDRFRETAFPNKEADRAIQLRFAFRNFRRNASLFLSLDLDSRTCLSITRGETIVSR